MANAPVKPALVDAERRFVECYLSNGRNGAKAWRDAIDPKADPPRACRRAATWLRRPNVKAALALADQRALARTEAMIERYVITEERVLSELASLAFSRPMDLMRVTEDGTAVVDLSTLDDRQAAAIADITVDEFLDGRKRVRVKLADKLRALNMLGAKLGVWAILKDRAGDGLSGGGLSALLEEAARLAEDRRAEQRRADGEGDHGDTPPG
jgi:hypothetical protein